MQSRIGDPSRTRQELRTDELPKYMLVMYTDVQGETILSSLETHACTRNTLPCRSASWMSRAEEILNNQSKDPALNVHPAAKEDGGG